jgi:hypothetical protein
MVFSFFSVVLGTTQPLTEISSRNLPGEGVKGGRRLRLEISSPFVSKFSGKCGSLYVLQPYAPPRPVTGMAFTSLLNVLGYNIK